MARNDRNEYDYPPDSDRLPSSDARSTGCGADGCSLRDQTGSSSPKGPISFLYPAAAIVAALLLLMMAVV